MNTNKARTMHARLWYFYWQKNANSNSTILRIRNWVGVRVRLIGFELIVKRLAERES